MSVIGFYSQRINKKKNEYFNIFKRLLSGLTSNNKLKLTYYTPAINYENYYSLDNTLHTLIKMLVSQERLDLLTGSYYQSILGFLPNKIRSSHIEMSSTYIRRNFKKKPRTIFLHDDIYTSSLAAHLKLADVKNICISTYNKMAKKTLENNPFIQQEMSINLNIYPTHDKLSSLFLDLYDDPKVIDQIVSLIKKSRTKIMMINLDQIVDCERKHNIEFLEYILEAACEVKNEFIEDLKAPTRKAHLESAYYGYTKSDIKTIFDHIYKHESLRRIYDKTQHYFELEKGLKLPKPTKNVIMENLSLASGLIYTHGPLDNLYDLDIRHSVSSNLCEVEKILLSSLSRGSVEHNFDLKKEYFFINKYISCSIIEKGATLNELSYIPTGVNYIDVPLINKMNGSSKINRGFSEKISIDSKVYDLKNKIFELDYNKKDIQFSLTLIDKIKIIKKYTIDSNNVNLQYTFENLIGNTQINFNLETFLALAVDNYSPTILISDENEESYAIEQDKIVNASNIAIYDLKNKTNLRLSMSDKVSIGITYINVDDRDLGNNIVATKDFCLKDSLNFSINIRTERKKN